MEPRSESLSLLTDKLEWSIQLGSAPVTSSYWKSDASGNYRHHNDAQLLLASDYLGILPFRFISLTRFAPGKSLFDGGSSVYVGVSGGQLFALPGPQTVSIGITTPLIEAKDPLPSGDTHDNEEEDRFCSLDVFDVQCFVGVHSVDLPIEPEPLQISVELDDSNFSTLNVALISIISTASAISLLYMLYRWIKTRAARAQAQAANAKKPKSGKSSKARRLRKKSNREENSAASESVEPASEHVVSESNGELKIGKLKVSSQVLGYGSSGTIVFLGEMDGRKVAVKRMLSSFYNVAEKEILLLLQADEHKNVIRYFAKVEQSPRVVSLMVGLGTSWRIHLPRVALLSIEFGRSDRSEQTRCHRSEPSAQDALDARDRRGRNALALDEYCAS
jgi:hypothetical protein